MQATGVFPTHVGMQLNQYNNCEENINFFGILFIHYK